MKRREACPPPGESLRNIPGRPRRSWWYWAGLTLWGVAAVIGLAAWLALFALQMAHSGPAIGWTP